MPFSSAGVKGSERIRSSSSGWLVQGLSLIHIWYPRDTSKKSRTVFKNKVLNGEHLSGVTPYG